MRHVFVRIGSAAASNKRGWARSRAALKSTSLNAILSPQFVEKRLIELEIDVTFRKGNRCIFREPVMRHKHSDYMHWSKTQSRARFNLATSGVAPFPLHELPVDLEELEINGTTTTAMRRCSKPSPRIMELIPNAWWNPPARPWRIISPWQRSLNEAMKS